MRSTAPAHMAKPAEALTKAAKTLATAPACVGERPDHGARIQRPCSRPSPTRFDTNDLPPRRDRPRAGEPTPGGGPGRPRGVPRVSWDRRLAAEG
jgi:hypothetical protein